MKKFIKVANVIANIILGAYEALMMIGTLAADSSNERLAIGCCMAFMALCIFVTNYSTKAIIKIWEKKVEKK